MKVSYDSITYGYRTDIKIYEPDENIAGFISAVHGFCGDTEKVIGAAERYILTAGA